MTSLHFYQIGLSALEGLSLETWSHQDLVAMVAGKLLKAIETEGQRTDESSDDCDRAARVCCSLAFHPQGVHPSSLFED